MEPVDLNLLIALDALLTEGSVTSAARRLDLSTSAMSRCLARLRSVTGDPLLVRAGRGLVPTPRAIELRSQVHDLARDVLSVLSPSATKLDIATLQRTFSIRTNEAFATALSTPLVAAITELAPKVRLRFAPKPVKDVEPLREEQIDLEIGVLEEPVAPEILTHPLFHDDFLGVVRGGHPLLETAMTPERYAACKHVVASRRGNFVGPVDKALEQHGLAREVVVVVPGFPDAIRIARRSDLVALVPRSCLMGDSPDGESAIKGMVSFELPVRTPTITVSAMWHRRVDADPAHRWFRDTVVNVCRAREHSRIMPDRSPARSEVRYPDA